MRLTTRTMLTSRGLLNKDTGDALFICGGVEGVECDREERVQGDCDESVQGRCACVSLGPARCQIEYIPAPV